MKLIISMATMPKRLENLPLIRDNFLAALTELGGSAGFEWHLIVYDNEAQHYPNIVQELAPVPVRFFVVHRNPKRYLIPFDKCEQSFTILCREGFEDPDTYISMWADDDFIACKTLTKLHQAYLLHQKPALVTSAARGMNTAASGHYTYPLIGARENMCSGLVTGEQYWIHQELLCGGRYGPARELPHDDGHFIANLHREHPDWVEFVPDAWMLFNALEPGRWTSEDQLNEYLNK